MSFKVIIVIDENSNFVLYFESLRLRRGNFTAKLARTDTNLANVRTEHNINARKQLNAAVDLEGFCFVNGNYVIHIIIIIRVDTENKEVIMVNT